VGWKFTPGAAEARFSDGSPVTCRRLISGPYETLGTQGIPPGYLGFAARPESITQTGPRRSSCGSTQYPGPRNWP